MTASLERTQYLVQEFLSSSPIQSKCVTLR